MQIDCERQFYSGFEVVAGGGTGRNECVGGGVGVFLRVLVMGGGGLPSYMRAAVPPCKHLSSLGMEGIQFCHRDTLQSFFRI